MYRPVLLGVSIILGAIAVESVLAQRPRITEGDADAGSIINYLEIYNWFGSAAGRGLFLGVCIIWLTFLFTGVGLMASDYFCPNLQLISSYLGLSESIAGVTFLGFANGSPDVFSTFSAMRSGTGSLAIGELLGAACFILAAVVGVMSILCPFTVDKRAFQRDLAFFTLSMLYALYIFQDGRLTGGESLVMIGLYVGYVTTIAVDNKMRERSGRSVARCSCDDFGSRLLEDQLEELSDHDEAEYAPRAQVGPREQALKWLKGSPSWTQTLRELLFPGATQSRSAVGAIVGVLCMPSVALFNLTLPVPFVLIGASQKEYDEELEHLEQSLNAITRGHPPATDTAGETEEVDVIRTPPRRTVSMAENDLVSSPAESLTILESPAGGTESVRIPMQPHYESPARQRTRTRSEMLENEQVRRILHRIQHNRMNQRAHRNREIAHALLRQGVYPYEVQDLLTEFSSKLNPGDTEGRGPVSLDPDAEDNADWLDSGGTAPSQEARRHCLLVLSVSFSPLFISMVLRGVSAASVGASLGLGAFLAYMTLTHDVLEYMYLRMCYCVLGIVVAMMWIMTLISEIIGVLHMIAVAFRLSDAIVGVTVFGFGNSFGDLVSNVMVARLGYPKMAVAACFGGPMLNILLGLGGSGLINKLGEYPEYTFSVTPSLVVCGMSLLVILAATAVFVPLNGYKMDRAFGIFILGIYAAFLCVDVLVEIMGTSSVKD